MATHKLKAVAVLPTLESAREYEREALQKALDAVRLLADETDNSREKGNAVQNLLYEAAQYHKQAMRKKVDENTAELMQSQ